MDDVNADLIDEYAKKIGGRLKRDGQLKDVSSKFAACNSDLERAEFILQLDDVNDIVQIPSTTDSALKCAGLAEKYRNDGNAQFKRKKDSKALLLYSQSIIHAPAASESRRDLALGYANRSAVLFHQQRYDACLNDIRRALNASYPKELQYKLYDRQAKCLMALKQYQLAGKVYHTLTESLEHSNLDEEKRSQWKKEIEKATAAWTTLAFKGIPVVSDDAEKQIAKLKQPPRLGANPSATFPSLSRRCEVEYSETSGRYIAAAEAIQTGEVLMIEKPFASVLLPDQYMQHCHVCFVRCDVMIPCTRCTLATYCSEKCRTKADTSFHRYECFTLEAIHKSGVGKFGHLALRAVTVKDAEFFQDFREMQQKVLPSQDAKLRGCNSEGKYRQDNYCSIHNLVTHSDLRTTDDLFCRAVKAAFLVKCLQKSNFFSNISDDSLVSYICGLILSHLQSFPCNAHEISELQLDSNNVAESLSCEIGAGIYATLSLFNHSCDPIATRHFYGDTCVVRSIRPGRKGEEISDNYGAVFAVQNKDDRQKMLKDQYYFDCECIACTQNWPMYLEVPHESPVLICTNCRGELGPHTQCPHCSTGVDCTEKSRTIKLATEKFHNGLKKLLLCDVTEATKHFSKALNLFHGNVKLPWRDVSNCEEGLKQCFSILSNCHELPIENQS